MTQKRTSVFSAFQIVTIRLLLSYLSTIPLKPVCLPAIKESIIGIFDEVNSMRTFEDFHVISSHEKLLQLLSTEAQGTLVVWYENARAWARKRSGYLDALVVWRNKYDVAIYLDDFSHNVSHITLNNFHKVATEILDRRLATHHPSKREIRSLDGCLRSSSNPASMLAPSASLVSKNRSSSSVGYN